jgi:hypothetical protein
MRAYDATCQAKARSAWNAEPATVDMEHKSAADVSVEGAGRRRKATTP